MMPRQPVANQVRCCEQAVHPVICLANCNAVPIPTENIWEMRGQPSLCANALSV